VQDPRGGSIRIPAHFNGVCGPARELPRAAVFSCALSAFCRGSSSRVSWKLSTSSMMIALSPLSHPSFFRVASTPSARLKRYTTRDPSIGSPNGKDRKTGSGTVGRDPVISCSPGGRSGPSEESRARAREDPWKSWLRARRPTKGAQKRGRVSTLRVAARPVARAPSRNLRRHKPSFGVVDKFGMLPPYPLSKAEDARRGAQPAAKLPRGKSLEPQGFASGKPFILVRMDLS